jgi:hypothetical protein
MPRLLVFVACEKAIVDNGNLVSLISLIQEVNLQIPPDAVIPNDLKAAAAPMHWSIVAIWERVPTDDGKVFEQRIAMFHSDGSLVFEAPQSVVDFKPAPPSTAPAGQHRTIGLSPSIPVREGMYAIKTWLRERGETEWGEERGSYPMKVNRITPS